MNIYVYMRKRTYEVHTIIFFLTGIWNCHRLLKIQYVIARYLMRWLAYFYDFRFKWTATTGIGIHPTKAWLSQLVNFKNVIWTWGHFRRTICNKNYVLNLEEMNASDCFSTILNEFLSGIRDSKKAGSLWGMMRGVGGVRKSIHQSWLAKGLVLGLLRWGFKGVQEEIPREEVSTLQIGSVAFQQDNTPVHNSILVTNYLTKMGIKTVPYTPYSPALAPCDFWLFPKLRVSLWDNCDERGCDEGHWDAHTRGLPWGLAEVVGTVQQVHCSRRRSLRRELEFYVCTINKSVHTKKV